jgi:hypothetical protein
MSKKFVPKQSVILMRAKAERDKDKPDSRRFSMRECEKCGVEAAYPDNAVYCSLCKGMLK